MLKYPKLRHQYLSLSPVNMLWKFVRSMLHISKASQENMDSVSWVFPIVSMIFKKTSLLFAILKTNDKIRKLTNEIFENWWIASSYRMLHMTEMASPDITFVWKMWGLEFRWLYHWSQWEYSISDKRVERFCWNLLWLTKIIYKVD